MLSGLASSRASPLPQGSLLTTKIANNRSLCGSGLAREEALTTENELQDNAHYCDRDRSGINTAE